MSGLLKGKPVIVVPRLEKYHEHVDDHQQQIAEAFAGKTVFYTAGTWTDCRNI